MKKERFVCRAYGWNYVHVFSSLAMAGVFVSIARTGHDTVATFLPCLFVALSVATAYSLSRQRIEVSEKGIRWKKPFGSVSASWDEVSDFYLSKKNSLPCIVTAAGVCTFSSGASNAELLKDTIVAKAGNRLGVTEWPWQGARLQDGDLTLGYDGRAQKNLEHFALALLALPLVVAVLAFLRFFVFHPVKDHFVGFEVAITVAAVAAFNLAPKVFANARASQKRLRQQFVAKADGFVFDDAGERVFVRWEDVVGYDFNPPQPKTNLLGFVPDAPFRLRTVRGQEFTFLSSISHTQIWMAIVVKRATEAIALKVDSERNDALGDVSLCWSGGTEGKGDRIFHRRTRGNFYSLMVPPIISLAVIGLLIVSLQGWLDLPPWIPALMLFALATLEAIMVFDFLTYRLQIGNDGITELRFGKQTFLAYDQIEDCRDYMGMVTLTRGDGSRLQFQRSSFAYGSRILPLLEEKWQRSGKVLATSGRAGDVATTVPLSSPRLEDRRIVEVVESDTQQYVRR